MHPPQAVSRLRLAVGLAFGIVAISFASIFIRFAQAEGVPTLSIAMWRLIFVSGLIAPYAWMRHRQEIRRLSRREWWLVTASGAFLGLHFVTWIASLGYTSVASSVVLVSMGPLFVGLGAWIFLRERPTLILTGGIGLAILGSILISWGDWGQGQDRLWGDMLALLGAMMVAGYLLIGRRVRPHHGLIAYVAPVYTIAMLVVLPIVPLAHLPMGGFSLKAYLWMFSLAVIPHLIGHSTLNWALRHLSATYVALVTLSEPIGASLLAYLLLNEGISWPVALGGGLILTGIAIASRTERGR